MATKELATFDYSDFDKESKGKLIWYAGEIRKQGSSHVKAGLEIGRLLSEARELIGAEDSFKAWVQRECGYARSSAYNYIAAHEHFGACPNLDSIELSAMYALTKNEKAKNKALKLADQGVKVTHALAKELIEKVSEKGKPGGVQPTSSPPDPASTVPVSEPVVRSEEAADLGEEESEGKTPPGTDAQPPRSGTDKPGGKCPNCAGSKWIEGEDGATCKKCGQPHGEPAGEVDGDRKRDQRALFIKHVEATMRAVDDLNRLAPAKEHKEAIRLLEAIWTIGKEWSL